MKTVSRFLERFPRYTFLLGDWLMQGPHRRETKTAWMQKVLWETTDVCICFGVGIELLDLLPSLKANRDRRLLIIETDPRCLVHNLMQQNGELLLENSQVDFFIDPNKALLWEIAERYPMRAPLFITPYFLSQREQKRYRQIRGELLQMSILSQGYWSEFGRCDGLLAHAQKNAQQIARSCYVNRWNNAFQNIPVIICGAGPSLDHSIEALRSLEQRALIVAGGSAISALTMRGIAPNFAVAVDPNPAEVERLATSRVFEIPLLFTARLNPNVFSLFNGPYGYIHSASMGSVSSYLDEQLGLNDRAIDHELAPEALSVTTLCMTLAYFWGCNPIIFTGLDLAYTDQRRYATGVPLPSEPLSRNPDDRRVMKKGRRSGRVASAVRFVMEASAIEQFIKNHRDRRWINATHDGLSIKGMEEGPLEAGNPLFAREWDLRGKVHQVLRAHPMPQESWHILSEKIDDLQKSIQRTLVHLDRLIDSASFGVRALAESDLEEEIAYQVLLAPYMQIAEKTNRPSLQIWEEMRAIIRRC